MKQLSIYHVKAIYMGKFNVMAVVVTSSENRALEMVEWGFDGYTDIRIRNIGISTVINISSMVDSSETVTTITFTDSTITYFDENGVTQSKIRQTELDFGVTYTPGRKTVGYGVERSVSNSGRYPTVYASYTKGVEGLVDSDFNYDKLQLYYRHRILMGGFGKLKYFLEAGKTFGNVPLTMLDVVPGNQTIFSVPRTFDLLNYYDFVTDEYAALHVEHNFNGRILSRIPLMRKLKWREVVSAKAVYGTFDQKNLDELVLADGMHNFERNKPFVEAALGIENIFKVLRVDGLWRLSYLDNPNIIKFGIRAKFQIDF